MKVLVIVEQTPTGFSAWSPDVDGCVVTGETREHVETSMREAVELHFEALREQGEHLPAPHTYATWVEVAA